MELTDKIFKFFGGIKPNGHKSISTMNPIKRLPVPKILIIPVRQHVGKVPNIKVSVGERVLKGQILAEPIANISAATHSSSSGTVIAIESNKIPHPSGLPDLCITIETDGKDEWIKNNRIDQSRLSNEALYEIMKFSGIVGLGGATFPTHIKLNSNKIKTLIVNAAECEPYITCDDMAMQEKTKEFIEGMQITMDILKIPHAIIGIEDNKPKAIEKLKTSLSGSKNISIKVVPTIYQSGDEKRLIYLMLGLKVYKEKSPVDFGIQVFNVANLISFGRFFYDCEPVIDRHVAVTGA